MIPVEQNPEVNRKARIALPPVGRAYREVSERVADFEECAIGLTPEEAMAEAARCLHCPQPSPCVKACPTGAIVAPYRVDARRCISYLTIELKGAIPESLRPAIGNRIYGCDDCQLACPWNRFARPQATDEFAVRAGLDAATLAELFGWSEREFDERLAGSPIRRIGHERWLRNLAVALGNSAGGPQVLEALRARSADASALVREHVAWALRRLETDPAARLADNRVHNAH